MMGGDEVRIAVKLVIEETSLDIVNHKLTQQQCMGVLVGILRRKAYRITKSLNYGFSQGHNTT